MATLSLALLASVVVSPTYEAKASVLLLPPSTPGADTNPYLGLGNYQPFADIVASATTDSTSVAALKAQGVTDAFTVLRDPTTNGPVIVVTVDGADATTVLTELSKVVRYISPVVLQLQQTVAVPAKARFVAKTITVDRVADVQRKSQIRAIIAAVAGGALGTLLVAAAVDNLLLRRRTRTGAARSDDGDEPGAASPREDDEPHVAAHSVPGDAPDDATPDDANPDDTTSDDALDSATPDDTPSDDAPSDAPSDDTRPVAAASTGGAPAHEPSRSPADNRPTVAPAGHAPVSARGRARVVYGSARRRRV